MTKGGEAKQDYKKGRHTQLSRETDRQIDIWLDRQRRREKLRQGDDIWNVL